MLKWSENFLPDVYECNVKDTGKRYRYNVSNAVDPELGKWREVTGGETDLSNYYNKNQIDNDIVKPVKEMAETNKDNIGLMSDLVVSTWGDLVTAINSLYNSFMSGMLYTTTEEGKKVLRITYRNGGSVDIDVSAIITDANIEELANVTFEDKADGDSLVYDVATDKWTNKKIDLAKVLEDAKTYTDESIAESEKTSAVACDEKPSYVASSKNVVYKQNGETKITDDINCWFYYQSGTTVAQTRWINDIEFTMDAGALDLSDYVKHTDVTGVFEENPTDLTKIPNLEYMNGLRNVILTAINKKVNKDDIVDALSSADVDKPLSANQGRVLDEKIADVVTALDDKLSIDQGVDNAGRSVVVGSEGKLILKEGGSASAENVTYENENYPEWTNVKKAIDGIMAKVDYVDPVINTFTMSCPAVNEVGSTVDSITFSWAYNKDMKTQTLTDCTLADANVRTADYTTPLTTTKTFSLSASDGEKTVKKDLTVAFRNKVYFGGAELPADFSSAFILGLAKNQFATSAKGSYTMSIGSGQYGFFAFPKSFGAVNSCYIGGFETELVNCGDMSFTNASGGVVIYTIVRTGRSGLGTITMEIK